MFFEHDYMIIKRIAILEMYNRKAQLLVLIAPDSTLEFHYPVNFKISLNDFQRNDKVRIELGISNKGASYVPYYYIKSIEHVILDDEVIADVC